MVNELRDRVHNLEGAPQRESSIIVPSVNIVFFMQSAWKLSICAHILTPSATMLDLRKIGLAKYSRLRGSDMGGCSKGLLVSS